MTLIVSLRIPDGIVIAGDSLSTMMSNMQIAADIDAECPECGYVHKLEKHPIGNVQMPATTFSYAQKIVPMLHKYGVGTFGHGQIIGQTIYYILRQLESEIKNDDEWFSSILSVEDIAQAIGERVFSLVKKDLENANKTLDDMPEDWTPVGFHIVGYTDGNPQILVLRVGKNMTIRHMNDACAVDGQSDIVAALFKMQKQKPNLEPAYAVFTLQDAIEYTRFLINTTALQQQFSRTIPTVGGDIDIALITPFDHFNWIQQKPLSKILGE